MERSKRWDELKQLQKVEESLASNIRRWGHFLQQASGRSKPQDIGNVSQGISDSNRLENQIDEKVKHFKNMWESTFGPGNKEVKSGLEEESSYYKFLLQKYKTLKQDITKHTAGLSEARMKLQATYRGICPRASSSKARRMKENKAKCKRRKLNRKLDRVLNFLSSLIVDETKRSIICKDAQSLKDVHDLSLSEIDCTIINNFSKKSDIKILSDILETCDNFQEEVAVLLKRKLLELKDIHLCVLDCSCSNDENISDGNINISDENSSDNDDSHDEIS